MSNQFHPPSGNNLKGKVVVLTGVCYTYMYNDGNTSLTLTRAP
jgi:hypothetical protein